MTVQTARPAGLGIRGAHTEIWNAGLAIVESAAFGLGIWVALNVLVHASEDRFFAVTGGPEAPIVAAVLFLVGRLWVGREGLSHPWIPRVGEAIVLAIVIGLLGVAAGRGYQMIAAYVPLPDAMMLGLLRGGWRAVALVAPYAFAADRPRRGRETPV